MSIYHHLSNSFVISCWNPVQCFLDFIVILTDEYITKRQIEKMLVSFSWSNLLHLPLSFILKLKYYLSQTPDITILYLPNKSITSLVSAAFNQVFSLNVSGWWVPSFFREAKLTLVGSPYLHITGQMLPTQLQRSWPFSPPCLNKSDCYRNSEGAIMSQKYSTYFYFHVQLLRW